MGLPLWFCVAEGLLLVVTAALLVLTANEVVQYWRESRAYDRRHRA